MSATRGPRTLLIGFVWAAYWIALLFVTHLPVTRVRAERLRGADKVLHFGLYYGLVLVGGYYLRTANRRIAVRVLAGWAVLYCMFAGLDEWTQRFVGRTPDWGDWLADTTGIIVATSLLIWKTRSTVRAGPGTDQI